MRFYTLSDNYEVTEILDQGKKLKIAFTREGIEVNDFIFLANYPSLQGIRYQVVDIRYLKGLFYADLIMVPELEFTSEQ